MIICIIKHPDSLFSFSCFFRCVSSHWLCERCSCWAREDDAGQTWSSGRTRTTEPWSQSSENLHRGATQRAHHWQVGSKQWLLFSNHTCISTYTCTLLQSFIYITCVLMFTFISWQIFGLREYFTHEEENSPKTHLNWDVESNDDTSVGTSFCCSGRLATAYTPVYEQLKQRY